MRWACYTNHFVTTLRSALGSLADCFEHEELNYFFSALFENNDMRIWEKCSVVVEKEPKHIHQSDSRYMSLGIGSIQPGFDINSQCG